jgi:hypothetical protein
MDCAGGRRRARIHHDVMVLLVMTTMAPLPHRGCSSLWRWQCCGMWRGVVYEYQVIELITLTVLLCCPLRAHIAMSRSGSASPLYIASPS